MGNDQTKPVRALIDGKIAGGECLHTAPPACSKSGGLSGFRVYYAARPRAVDRPIFPFGVAAGTARS